MKTFCVSLLLVLLALHVQGAGAEYIIKQRAKELRDQNNASQGVPPAAPAQQPQPAAKPVAPVPTAVSPAQQNMARFQADLALVRSGSTITLAQKQKLEGSLLGMAQGPKPTQANVEKFVGELVSAMTEKPLSAAARSRLVQDLDGLLNPAKYPQAKPNGIIDDIESIFKANGNSATQARVLSSLARVLASEVQIPAR